MTENEAIQNFKRELRAPLSPFSITMCDIAIQALEKQIPKRPMLCRNEKSVMFADYADGHGECKVQMNNWWRCPCCNSVVGQRVIVHKRVHDQRKKKYCEDCGQAIDWNEADF